MTTRESLVKNAERTTNGLAQGGVFARRKSCRTFKRSHPREHLCSPALRQAADRWAPFAGDSAVIETDEI
jgi:hypothetical protein